MDYQGLAVERLQRLFHRKCNGTLFVVSPPGMWNDRITPGASSPESWFTMAKKFSVIIPLLNKGPYIERAIRSVLAQTCQEFEIIIVEGGSEDDGPAVVRKIKDPRIHCVNQTGRGVSNARNEGVDLAVNEYLAFLDADDEWMPGHLNTIARLAEKHPGAGLFTTAVIIQLRDGKRRWLKYRNLPKPPWEGLIPNFFTAGIAVGFPLQTSSVAIPKRIFLEMGGFLEDFWYGEDVDLFGKIALAYPVAFSWDSGIIYHWDATNRARDKELPLDYREPFIGTALAALAKGTVPQEYVMPLHEYISMREIDRAIRNVRSGNPKTARQILRWCVTHEFIYEKVKWQILAWIPVPLFHGMIMVKRTFLSLFRK